MSIDFLLQEQISPSWSLATDQYFLQTASQKGIPVLRVYTVSGDALSVGRYHMASEALQPAFEALQQEEITCFRRFTGGRVMPCGDGFTGFSLILPHRSALLSDDPLMLAPFQVMNRYVRGILTGLKNFGVNVFYPGRDFLTVRQKSVGWVSFTTEAGGALLFEGILSVNRDFSILPYFLDKVDPGGVLPSQFLTPDTTTSLSQEVGKEIAVSPVADLLRHGYATQFSHNVEQRELTSTEKEVVGEIVAKEFATSSRLYGCTLRPDLPCYGMSSTQLGTFTVCFSLTPELLLREVKFSGDFITNAEALAALEQELERCPAERQAIWQAVDRVFTRPQNFLLGIGPLETIPETIIKGLPQTDPR